MKGQSKNYQSRITEELVRLAHHPAYQLLQAGCKYFKYELAQNEFIFSLSGTEHGRQYEKDFHFKHTTAETFLESALLPYFDTMMDGHRSRYTYSHPTMSQLQSYFNIAADLVDQLLKNEQKPAVGQQDTAETRDMMWELYKWLEKLTNHSGYLKHITTHCENDFLFFEVHLRKGIYEFKMTPQGLSKFFELVQALCFCRTAHDENPYCAEIIIKNLQKTANDRSCLLDLKTTSPIASLLKVTESQLLTFKIYDLSNDDAPDQLYQLIQDINNCPRMETVKDPGKIYEVLCYANRANAELLLNKFPTLLTLANKD